MIHINYGQLADTVASSVNAMRPYKQFQRYTTGSIYLTYEDKQGDEFTIRISDHKKSSRPNDQTQTFNTNDIEQETESTYGIRIRDADYHAFINRIVRCIDGKKERRDILRGTRTGGGGKPNLDSRRRSNTNQNRSEK